MNDIDATQELLESVLKNSFSPEEQKKDEPIALVNNNASLVNSFMNFDSEVNQCPMCYWQFPRGMTVDGKREHIENHFQ